MYAVGFLFTLMMGTGMPLVPQYLATDLVATTQFIGFAVALYGILQVVLRLPMGNLTDVYGRRMTLVWSFVVSFLGGLFFMLAPDKWWILPGQALFGLASGIFWVSANSYVADRAEPTKVARAMSNYTIGMGFGFLLSPPLSGLLADRFGYRYAFAIFLASSVLALLILWSMPETRKGAPRLTTMAAYRKGVKLLEHPDLTISALGTFFLALLFGVASAFYPLHVRALGYSAFLVGILLAVREGTSITSRILLPPLMSRTGPRPILLVGVAVGALGVGVTPFLHSYWLLAVFMVVAGLGIGVMIPANLTLITQASAPEERGLAMGIYGTALGLGTAASSFGFGLVGQHYGLPAAFLGAGAASLLGVLVVAALMRRGPARSAAGPPPASR